MRIQDQKAVNNWSSNVQSRVIVDLFYCCCWVNEDWKKKDFYYRVENLEKYK
jgi:hypothetical protein